MNASTKTGTKIDLSINQPEPIIGEVMDEHFLEVFVHTRPLMIRITLGAPVLALLIGVLVRLLQA